MNRRTALSRLVGWRTKAAVLAGLSRVPRGRALYRQMQDALGTARLDIIAQYSNKRRALQTLAAHGIERTGDVLEIGSGWHPVMPLLLSLIGARSVVTVDLNPWMTERSLLETIRGMALVADKIAADFGVPESRTIETMRELDAVLLRFGIRETLRLARVDYRPHVDGSATGLSDHSVDLIVSTGLLEHVPPDVIPEMTRESARILRRGGSAYHYINPGDHFASDPRITKINFLRYAEPTWRWIGGSGLSYHNRLRASDYARILTPGFEVVSWITRTDSASVEFARKSRLHGDFAHYEIDDLCTDDVVAVLRSNGARAIGKNACKIMDADVPRSPRVAGLP